MGANVPENKALTPRQVRALAELAAGQGVTSAAAVCGVAPKTIRRWQQEPAFAAELKRLQGEGLRSLARRLVSLGDDAAAAIARGLDPEAPLTLQLRAAALVTDRAPALVTLVDLIDRVEALENHIGQSR